VTVEGAECGLKNITAISWLYRGQQERYLQLVGEYLNQTHQESQNIAGVLNNLDSPLTKLIDFLQNFNDSFGDSLPLLKDLPEVEELVAEDIAHQNIEIFRNSLNELKEELAEFTTLRKQLIIDLQAHLAWFNDQSNLLANNQEQKDCAAKFAVFIPQLKTLQKQINELHKLVNRTVEIAEKKLDARKQESWDGKEIKQQQNALDTVKDTAISVIKSTLYMKAQVTWLQSRFPDGVFVNVPGLCQVVTLDNIAQEDYSLTPGRYVGVAAVGGEDEEDIEERLKEIHLELASLNEEAQELGASILVNFEELFL
jgi:type I restriction enzyme M protein